MKKPVWIGIVLALAIIGYIVYSSMNLASHRVEICIAFNGRATCRTASGATEEFARRTATTNACGELASGVTDSIACENTPPSTVKILK